MHTHLVQKTVGSGLGSVSSSSAEVFSEAPALLSRYWESTGGVPWYSAQARNRSGSGLPITRHTRRVARLSTLMPTIEPYTYKHAINNINDDNKSKLNYSLPRSAQTRQRPACTAPVPPPGSPAPAPPPPAGPRPGPRRGRSRHCDSAHQPIPHTHIQVINSAILY